MPRSSSEYSRENASFLFFDLRPCFGQVQESHLVAAHSQPCNEEIIIRKRDERLEILNLLDIGSIRYFGDLPRFCRFLSKCL